MQKRLYLLALPLALWACQNTLYPVAPDVPARVTTGSPAPGSDPTASQRGPYGGLMVRSGSHYLEFVPYTPPGGEYLLYLFPWDASLSPLFRSKEDSRATLTLSNGREIPLEAAINSEDGSLFFYVYPEASFKQLEVTIEARVTLGSTVLTGSFPHPDR